MILSVIVHLEAIFHGVVSNNAMTMGSVPAEGEMTP